MGEISTGLYCYVVRSYDWRNMPWILIHNPLGFVYLVVRDELHLFYYVRLFGNVVDANRMKYNSVQLKKKKS